GEMRVLQVGVDLADLVRDVCKTLQAAAAEREVDVRFHADDGPRRAWGDPLRTRQVLLNLASNAVKYNRAGGRVDIRMHAEGGSVCVSVTDDGPGLSPAQQAQLFRPYERLGAERGRVQGTGIGLNIARRLAELMGGDIAVRSEPGQGSCFTLRLPVAPPTESSADADTTVSEFGGLAASNGAAGTRVLYVEDNEVNRMVFEACLALRPGVELHMAHDGRQALHLAASTAFDLVVLDLNLPDMSGLALAQALQEHQGGHAARLALLTADATPGDDHATGACGIRWVWRKPFEVADLLAQIDAALASA
ncbi:MAG: ATP-binding protein, partial [Rubrivivax sp.]|nr:ATP-binding protein [Rubrivivax sp.]